MSAALHADISTIKTGPTVEIVQVSPALAETWLHQNTHNRTVRRSEWLKYSRDMQAGEWKLTGEPIKFDANGKLLDGQHRLLAIIDADVTIPLFVVTGLSQDAQDAMDSGAKRTAADALGLRGTSHSALSAAIARLALGVAYSPENLGKYPATHAEIIDWVDDHRFVVDAAAFAHTLRSRISCPPSVVGYSFMQMADLDYDAAVSFWTAVAEQMADYPGDPVVALARRLNEARREREDLSKHALLSMIYRAWNNRRGSKPMRVVKVNSTAGGLIPVPVPR